MIKTVTKRLLLRQRLVLITRLLLVIPTKSPTYASQSVSVLRIKLNVCSIVATSVVAVKMPSLLMQARMLQLFQEGRKKVKIKVYRKQKVQSLGLRN